MPSDVRKVAEIEFRGCTSQTLNLQEQYVLLVAECIHFIFIDHSRLSMPNLKHRVLGLSSLMT